MNKGIFITGTDTGVGKTFVAVGLIEAMKRSGFSVCPMKPVESGCKVRNGELVPADAIKLIRASGVDEKLDEVIQYRLRNPLAPAVAAELEGVKITKSKILSAYRRISKRYDYTIIEGAGGIMVPVYEKYLFIDLAEDLGLPVVIVSRPGLGTINHTLLTIEVLRNKGLDVAGVIFNYSEKTRSGLSEKTNPEIIEKLGNVPVLGNVPFAKASDKHLIKKVFNDIARKIVS